LLLHDGNRRTQVAFARILDWTEDTRDVVARWRAMTATCPDPNGRLRRLITEFKDLSPHFTNWWDTHDVREHRSRLRTFEHPVHGTHTLRLIVVQAQDYTPCVVVFHVPVDTTPPWTSPDLYQP